MNVVKERTNETSVTFHIVSNHLALGGFHIIIRLTTLFSASLRFAPIIKDNLKTIQGLFIAEQFFECAKMKNSNAENYHYLSDD